MPGLYGAGLGSENLARSMLLLFGEHRFDVSVLKARLPLMMCAVAPHVNAWALLHHLEGSSSTFSRGHHADP